MLLPQRSPDAAEQRRNRILDAAERCFVRAGFHRTTMQDVAAEAGMSAGNLYRYFPSKESIVSGLAERDREEMSADFARISTAADFLTTFESIGRKHLVESPREKAVLAVEIWSEATRNPHVSGLCTALDGEVCGHMRQVFEKAQAAGLISPETDIDMAVRLMLTVADGLFKRRALDPAFDGEHELRVAMAMFSALFAGQIRPMPEPVAPIRETTP